MMENTSKKVISMVLPVYNEEENLQVFYKDLSSAASELSRYDFEFIFVDDCSSDRTPSILEELRRSDARVQIIRLRKNFGSHAAMSAGFLHCRGDAAIVVAVDMQDHPSVVVPGLVRTWEDGYKVVWGVREKKRGETLLTAAFSKAFYMLMNKTANLKYVPSNIGSLLIDRAVIDTLNQFREKNSSVTILISWFGFPQERFVYACHPRHAGRSKWTLTKKIGLSLNSLVSFSYTPMRFMSLIGVCCTAAGVGYAVHIVINRLSNNITTPGWTTLMVAVLLLGGIQMVMLGILGEYLWRAYDEVRPRPQFIIEKNTMQQEKKER